MSGGRRPAWSASAKGGLATAGTAKATAERHGLLPNFERIT